MKYYYVSRRTLKVGAQLNPGIYGERINGHDMMEDNYTKYITEHIFESIRKEKFSNCPSRFDAIFLFEDEDAALAYWTYQEKRQGAVYEIEIIEGTIFQADMSLLWCEGAPYSTIVQNAQSYWSGLVPSPCITKEILLIGQAKVKVLAAPLT